MAQTNFAVNHPLAVKLWAKRLFAETLNQMWFARLMGTTSSAAIQRMTDLQKAAGDQLTFGLRMVPTGRGVVGDAQLEGNEEALTTFNDQLTINQLRHAMDAAGKMSQERVPFNVRNECKAGLVEWWSKRFDEILFNHLAGYTLETDAAYIGANAIAAPTTLLLSNTAAANEAALAAPDVFTLTMIDRAVARAKTMRPRIRPVRVGGEDMYICVLHPFQVLQLRTNTNAGQWADIQKAQLQGGQAMKDNPLGNGLLGIYNNTLLYESDNIPNGINAGGTAALPNVRRAVFMGAQAAVVGFGSGVPTGDEMFSWEEKTFDYGNRLGVACASIFGIKKTRFNNADFGVITLGSFSPQSN